MATLPSPPHAEDSGGCDATVPSHSLPCPRLLSIPRGKCKSTRVRVHTHKCTQESCEAADLSPCAGVWRGVTHAIGHVDREGI